MKTIYTPDAITIEVDDATKQVSLYFRNKDTIVKLNLTQGTAKTLTTKERDDFPKK